RRPDVAEARRLYDSGDRRAALAAWPGNVAMERRVLEVLVSTDDPVRAAKAIDRATRRFYLSAAQSAVFNRVLADRVTRGTLARVEAGDVAVKHVAELRTGGMFVVEDVAAEQARC